MLSVFFAFLAKLVADELFLHLGFVFARDVVLAFAGLADHCD